MPPRVMSPFQVPMKICVLLQAEPRDIRHHVWGPLAFIWLLNLNYNMDGYGTSKCKGYTGTWSRPRRRSSGKPGMSMPPMLRSTYS